MLLMLAMIIVVFLFCSFDVDNGTVMHHYHSNLFLINDIDDDCDVDVDGDLTVTHCTFVQVGTKLYKP